MPAASKHFHDTEEMSEDENVLGMAYRVAQPDIEVHLAAKVGVRYSLEDSRSYVQSNVVGTHRRGRPPSAGPV